MLSVKSSPPNSANWRQPSGCWHAQQGYAVAKDGVGRNAEHSNKGDRCNARTRTSAGYDGKSSCREAQLAKPRQPDPCARNWQDTAGDRCCMQGRAPEPCRHRHFPAQESWPHRRARRQVLRHAADRSRATRCGLTPEKLRGRAGLHRRVRAGVGAPSALDDGLHLPRAPRRGDLPPRGPLRPLWQPYTGNGETPKIGACPPSISR